MGFGKIRSLTSLSSRDTWYVDLDSDLGKVVFTSSRCREAIPAMTEENGDRDRGSFDCTDVLEGVAVHTVGS